MTPDKVFVLIFSLGLIVFVYWYFLGKKTKKGKLVTEVEITVSGGYSPQEVFVPSGKPITLTFLRTDSNSCLEEVIIPDLKIKKELPLNTKVLIEAILPHPGEYIFHCGMNMFTGKIIAI